MDSDDDMPLIKSKPKVTTAEKKHDKPNGAPITPGIAVRNGPAPANASPHTNGVGSALSAKRKARNSGVSYTEAADSEDDDDMPLGKRRKTSAVKPKKEESDSDMSDVPIVTKAKKPAPKSPASTKKPKDDSDSDVPLGKLLAADKAKMQKRQEKEGKKATPAKAPKLENGVHKSTPVKKAKIEKKSPATTPAKKIKAKEQPKPKKEEVTDDDEQADDEEYRWWEAPMKGDGTKKWDTLQHNGVVFPPPYQPLPKNVKLIYNGVPVSLPPVTEEVATFYGSMLHSPNLEIARFNQNFFEEFKALLDKHGHGTGPNGEKITIKDLAKCDFKDIHNHFMAEREAKKAIPSAEKKRLKAEKDEAEAPYMFCMWDGRKQKVGNFRIEPPGLFRGRGEHPKTGRIKQRVQPEQVTINIGEDAMVPPPPAGHKWKEIKHDHEGTWLAMWQENINGAYKYVMLAATSDIKGQSDFKKFEKARALSKYIGKIRKDYKRDLKSDMMADRQRATAIYLIDQLALRAGNEKGEDEAETVGCCSLKYENVTLKPPNTLVFDFLGKDSIRFYDEVKVDEQVFKNMRLFKKSPKKEGDEIFDRLTTAALNKHLTSYMAGLTAKVFRTYNASKTMSDLLQNLKSTGTIPEKLKDFNDANRQVAILCNHKRTVTAAHAGQMEKMEDRINGLRYQQWRLKQMMLELEPKMKKKLGAEYFQRPGDLDDEWVEGHHEKLVQESRQKIEKKFTKENEKLAAEGQKEMKAKELEDRQEVSRDLEKKLKKERKTKKVEPEGRSPTVERYEKEIEKLDERISTMRVQAEDKDSNKEVALSTSIDNYIDPRLAVVFSKKFDVPLERLFNKTRRQKFDWAVQSVDEHWQF